MLEIDREKESIYQAINKAEKNSLFILTIKTIYQEEKLAQDFSTKLDIVSVNLGNQLSQKLNLGFDRKYLNLEVEEILNQIIESFSKDWSGLKKKLLLLYNTGILWEPELKLALEPLFRKIIKHTNLILVWSGSIDTVSNKIFLLEKDSSYLTQLNEMQIYVYKE